MAEPHPASLQRPVLCFAQFLCLMLPLGVVSGHTQTVYKTLKQEAKMLETLLVIL